MCSNAYFPITTAAAPHATAPPAAADRRVGLLLGTLALLSAVTAIALILVGDPYWLTAPAAASAVGLAQLVLYRYNEDQLSALIGNALGQCALMLWLVIDLAVRYLIGFELSLINIIRDMAAS